MGESYAKLLGFAMLNVIASLIFFLLIRKTKFKKVPKALKQIIIGLIFGGIAVLGTEFGVDIGGAVINVRDASPLCAGLIFGGPAGIIAGFIGGIERFFATYWGVGTYTQLACTISTSFAGIYAALLRKYLFKGKRPSALIGFGMGIVMEAIHMTALFFTHFDDSAQCLDIIKKVFIPMALFTGLSVLLSVIFVNIISYGIRIEKDRIKTISQKIQSVLIIVVILTFVLITTFVFVIQSSTAISSYSENIKQTIKDVELDIKAASNNNLLNITKRITKNIQNDIIDNNITDSETINDYLLEMKKEFDVNEVHIIGSDDIVKYSSSPKSLNFDMNSTEQSSEFSILNTEQEAFIQDYSITSNTTGNGFPVKKKYVGYSLSKGYVQVGFLSSQFQDDIRQNILELTSNRHIGQTGYVIVGDSSRNVVSTGENSSVPLIDIGIHIDTTTPPDTMLRETILGQDCYYIYQQSEGYYIIGVVPSDEVYLSRDNSFYLNTVVQILVFAIFFIFLMLIINEQVIKKIETINKNLAEISSGNLDVKVNVDSTSEFINLSNDINTTVNTLKDYISEAEQRIDKELEFAKNIQTSALPNVFPPFPNIKNFDLYATMDTAKEVGGDFYDFYMLGESRLAILIADVSGKGIPAAMFMMNAKSMLKNLVESGIDIAEAFNHANIELCNSNNAGMFVTVFMGILDINTGHLIYVNAGHNPPAIYNKETGYTYLKCKPGFVLTGMEGLKYKTQEVYLSPGDKIYMYTDGVTEAINVDSEMYAEERLLNYLNAHADYTPEQMLKGVKENLDEFVGEADQFDDITMLMLDFHGKENESKYYIEKEFNADIKLLDNVLAFAEENLEKVGVSFKEITQFNIVIEEIFVNIAHYAYNANKGLAWITFDYDENKKEVMFRFVDKGYQFNPLAKDDPNITLSAEERDIGGLGIFMVKKMMDDIKYEYVNGENVLWIMKKID